ncbi:MAG: site-specific integrase [Roseivirga sp.]
MTKVTLREKPLVSNKISLFLDFYPPILNPTTGKPTRREFLQLYLFKKPTVPTEKNHNKATKALAESIRAQRIIDLQQGQHTLLPHKTSPTDLLHYFQALASRRKPQQAKNYAELWKNVFLKLAAFTKSSCPLQSVDQQFCEEFRNFLIHPPANQTKIALSTAQTYFVIFKTVIKTAYEERLIKHNPTRSLRGIPLKKQQRRFLTLGELKSIRNTPCLLPILKRAALFSALTGLRFSDIQALRWEALHYAPHVGHYLRFFQQKTASEQILPIAEPAFELMGTQQEPSIPIFKGLPQRLSSWHNVKLRAWVKEAGISKHITFHSFRHSFATMQLTLGVDIYTVSKMLGHQELRTTQLYGQIIDQKKRGAMDQLAYAWNEIS